MKESDPSPRDEASEASDDGFDSVLRAVAHVSTVDMPGPQALGERGTDDALGEPLAMPKAGDVLDGRYRLDTLLGAGGMGAVFAAKNLRTDKHVAVKVLLPQRGGQRIKRERVVRFVREARAAGRIRHPNVVDVYDVEGEGETPYIVMERLHGESLWARIKRGPMAPNEAVDVLLAAMLGVAEAHKQGVIHRDLKPDNIFLAVTRGSSEAVPKVLDFGVSRIVAREALDEQRPTTITRTGYVVGTPSYMPLEQLRGDPNVDARADVYALGVILYEALSGARPFEAQNDHDLVIRMVTERPTPLRTRATNLDPTLESIVMRALAKDPAARFADVESFARALTAWRTGDEHTARTESQRGLPSTMSPPAGPPPASALRRGVIALLVVGALWGLWALYGQKADVVREQPAPSLRAEPEPAMPTKAALEPVLTPELEPTTAPPVEASAPKKPKRAGVKKPPEDRATKLLEQDF